MVSLIRVPGPLLVPAMLAACSSGPICSEAALAAALQKARSGDTIHIGHCTLTGSFTVPAGVVLTGDGEAASIINAPADHPALVLVPGTAATEISQLGVSSKARVAVLARGSGRATIRDVHVAVSLGIGLGVEAADALTLQDVTVQGPVTAANVNGLPSSLTSTESATYGVVMVHVASAQITNLVTNGFAEGGALFSACTLAWQGGNASSNLGLGVYVEGGSATLTGVEIADTLQGLRLIPAYGAVFTQNATIETQHLSVHEGQGYGILHDTGSGKHIDLDVENNTDAAVWVQGVDSIEVTGTISRNGFAGVVAVDARSVSIHDAMIDQTKKSLRVLEETGSIEVGDGVQLVRSMLDAHLSQLSLTNNGRVGVLCDLGGNQMVSAADFDHVAIDAPAGAFGAVAENGQAAMGWDSGITRMGAATAAANAMAHLKAVMGVGPCERPRDSHLADMGLMLLTGT
jgi:hypothetical protein